jgi:DNA polymerase-3 subunit alpha
MLAHEKELLGFYVTGHPLDDYRGSIESGSYTPISEVIAMTEPGSARLAGLLASMEKKFTKKDGRPFGVMTLEDDSGTLEVTAWDESFSKHEQLLKTGSVISCMVKVVPRDGMIRATASDFKVLNPKSSKKPLRLRLDQKLLKEEDFPIIMEAIKKNHGKRPLILEILTPTGSVFPLQLGSDFCVGYEQQLRVDLDQWLCR